MYFHIQLFMHVSVSSVFENTFKSMFNFRAGFVSFSVGYLKDKTLKLAVGIYLN